MRTLIAIIVGLVGAPVAAQTTQSRFYVGATTAVDAGERGNVPSGAVPSAGMLFGVRLTGGMERRGRIRTRFQDHVDQQRVVLGVLSPSADDQPRRLRALRREGAIRSLARGRSRVVGACRVAHT